MRHASVSRHTLALMLRRVSASPAPSCRQKQSGGAIIDASIKVYTWPEPLTRWMRATHHGCAPPRTYHTPSSRRGCTATANLVGLLPVAHVDHLSSAARCARGLSLPLPACVRTCASMTERPPPRVTLQLCLMELGHEQDAEIHPAMVRRLPARCPALSLSLRRRDARELSVLDLGTGARPSSRTSRRAANPQVHLRHALVHADQVSGGRALSARAGALHSASIMHHVRPKKGGPRARGAGCSASHRA